MELLYLLMPIFPTQYSLLAAYAIGQHIEQFYDLKQLTCRLLIHNVSDTYLIEGLTGKYIFKIYRDAHRSLTEIQAEAELLIRLADAGAQVSYPIADIHGGYIQYFNAAEGMRHGLLFSYARGEVVMTLNNQHLKLLGRAVAEVHNLTAGMELSGNSRVFDVEHMLLQPLARIKPAFVGLESEYRYLEAQVNSVAAKMVALDTKGWGYGYCHYDLLPKNFHFEGVERITLFDFDFAGKGFFVNDLASFYVHYFMDVYLKRTTQEQADIDFAEFVESYRNLRNVSDAELQAIPYFGFAFWVFYLGFQYDNFEDWSNSFFGPRFLKDRVGLIRQWVDWYVR